MRHLLERELIIAATDNYFDERQTLMTALGTTSPADACIGRRDLRNTGVLVAFTAMTNLADGVTKVALPLLAARITHSPLSVSLVSMSLTLPWLFTALHIGVLADRADRRMLIVVANAMRLVAVGLLLWLVGTREVSLGWLYAGGGVLGVAEVLALTASAALVPAVVSRDGQERANAWMAGAETVCNDFCGPFFGGVLVLVGYIFALSSTAVAFLITLVLPLALIGKFRPEIDPGPPVPVRSQIGVGLSLLWRTPLLRTMALTLTVLCICWGAWMGLIPLLAIQELHATSAEYGVLLSSLGIGGFAGAMCASPLNRFFGRRRVMFCDIAGTFAMVAAPLLSRSIAVIAVSAFLGGLGGTLWTVNARTIAQRLVPTAVMGRFWAAWRLFSWGALPVGSVMAGVLGDVIGLRAAFLPFSILVLLLVVPFLRVVTDRALRTAESTGSVEITPLTTP